MLKTIVATFQTVMGSSLSQQSAVEIIKQWGLKPPHELIFDSSRREREISQYMQAVVRLQQSANGRGVNEIISIAMERLRGEFDAVLSRQADHPAVPISTTEWSTSVSDSTALTLKYGDYPVPDPPSDDVIAYLRSIAERMNSSGRLGECVEVYKRLRRSNLQAQLSRLRFEELRMGNNARRYSWEELKVKMELWIEVSKICVKILFEREKRLCKNIFEGIGEGNAAKDECFVGTVGDFAADLFGFARAISLSNQPYKGMETILGLYDAILWVLPKADALFLSQPGKRNRNICAETLSGIENDAGRMLHDIENDVLHEISNVSDNGGIIHHLMKEVMEQINLIVKKKELLTKLIKSTPSLNFGDLVVRQDDLGDSHNRSFLQLHLILIIVVLQKNLEDKSKRCPDSSLGQLFVMNNVHYIVKEIKGSNELKEMIGESYLRKLDKKFEDAMRAYQTSACNKFLTCFEDEGLYITWCCKSRPSKTAVRNRLKAFNEELKKVQSLQSSWTIPDSQLRDDVCVSMCGHLVPAYKNFLEQFESNPEMKLILDNIKYSAEDLQALVLEKMFAHTEVTV